jgi:hypothetical protein
MTPPDLDEAVRLARRCVEAADGSSPAYRDWYEEETDTKLARALLALEPVWRAAQEWRDAPHKQGCAANAGWDAGCERCVAGAKLVGAVLDSRIATARRGGG